MWCGRAASHDGLRALGGPGGPGGGLLGGRRGSLGGRGRCGRSRGSRSGLSGRGRHGRSPLGSGRLLRRGRRPALGTRLRADSEASLIDFLADIIEDWSGVRDAEDKAIAYSADALRQLCAIPGIAAVAFRTYIAEVGAKEKN